MSASPIDAGDAARLIERLLVDAELRERFRRDPVRVCRGLGFEALAEELAAGSGDAAQTLELRESRSSLAGVLMAAAIEGVALAQVLEQARAAGGAVAEVARRVTLPELPSLPDPRGGGGAAPSGGMGVAADGAAVDGAAGAALTPGDGASSGAQSEAPEGPAAGAAAAVAPPGGEPPQVAGARADATTPEVPAQAPVATSSEPAAQAAAATTPEPPAEPAARAPDAAAATTPEPAAATTPESAPAASPELTRLLASEQLDLDAAARATLLAGHVPPRAIALLEELAGQHRIAVRIAPQQAGIVDITAIDDVPVSEANIVARDLAQALAARPAEARPLEIATPWKIDGAPFVRDPTIDDRLRLTFDPPKPAEAPAPAASPEPAEAPEPVAAPSEPASTPEPAASPAPVGGEQDEVGTGARRTARSAPADDDDLQFAEPPARRADARADADDDELAFPAADSDEPVGRRAEVADGEPLAIPPAGDYPGDGAPRSELAAWMAAKARERGLPPELPVMASLVESGLQNLNHGDRDSVGFFQMRLGIWNSGAYRGYPERPELQLKWFLDHAVEVRDQRLARGQAIDDPSQYGTWIADVERPAEQYRGRYQLRLDEARELLRGGGDGASRAATTEPAPPEQAGGGEAAPIAPTADGLADAVLSHPRLHLDEIGQGDVRAGRLDPRVLSLLLRLADDHDLRISCTKSDHSQFTAGGSVSNHFHGRAFDIAFVDGEIVNGASPRSRTLAEQLATLPAAIRPDEIGTPWPIAGPGYFTDAGHQDHLHVGFKTELPSDWSAPQSLASPAAAVRASEPAAPAGVQAADRDDLSFVQEPARRAAAEQRASVADSLSLPVPAAQAEAATAASDAPAQAAPAAATPTPTAPAPPAAGSSPSAEPASAAAEAPAGDGALAARAALGDAPVASQSVDDDGLVLDAPARRQADAADNDTLSFPVAGAGAAPRAARLEASAVDAIDAAPAAFDAPTGYPGDDAGRVALARWLGGQARRHGLPPELPVMASLVESGLQNLNYGDRDSVGFFQMRTGIWNTGAYRGYPERPDLQARWFIDHALAVRRARIAAGDADFGRDASTWGEWIADVERPAEQYRGRYQLRLAEARRLLRGE